MFMSPTIVTVENFNRAETHRMFTNLQAMGGAPGEFFHVRSPASVDAQPVIRMNRDTLYSAAIIDLSSGATLTIPDSGERYLSVMVINEDHYVTHVLHAPGTHSLEPETLGGGFAAVLARTFVDPNSRDDLLEVRALQNELAVTPVSPRTFEMPIYDEESFDGIRKAVLRLGKGLASFDGAFGRKGEVDPIKHLLGTAAGWGGLPLSEAVYVSVDPNLPVDRFQVTVKEVPADAFWSISVYNRDGFFEKNDQERYSLNNVTAERDPDGAVTVTFGSGEDPSPNFLPITEGWNFVVRLYKPRPAATDGTWSFPSIVPAP